MLRLSLALMLIGLAAALGVSSYLERHYAFNRPATAEPLSGRVHFQEIRGGHGVYVTQAEQWALLGSRWGGTLVLVAGGFLFEWSRRRDGSGAA